MGTKRESVEFTFGGVSVWLALVGERWIARVGESVAVGSSARLALTAALDPLGRAKVTALLADLALLEPSIAALKLERSPTVA